MLKKYAAALLKFLEEYLDDLAGVLHTVASGSGPELNPSNTLHAAFHELQLLAALPQVNWVCAVVSLPRQTGGEHGEAKLVSGTTELVTGHFP